MTAPQPRPILSELPRYVPGARGTDEAAPPIKLSSNETPLGPLAGIVESIASAGAAVNRYPDMSNTALAHALAESRGVAVEKLALGAGSVAVLGHILQAFCDAGEPVVYAWRSFEAYPIIARIAGADIREVPLAGGGRHDLHAMALAAQDARVVFLCSPNNPTGPAIEAEEFEAFMLAVPRSTLVVLDEAYAEFVRAPDAVDGLDFLDRHPNLVVTRTFSKAYGLAGLRVGYAIAAPEIAAAIRACVTPFSVSSVAHDAALASLAAEAALLARVEEIVAERSRVVAALGLDGWAVPNPQGNFVWISAGSEAVGLAAHMRDGTPAIVVRPFPGDGVRITLGSKEENDAMLAALAQYPQRF